MLIVLMLAYCSGSNSSIVCFNLLFLGFGLILILKNVGLNFVLNNLEVI